MDVLWEMVGIYIEVCGNWFFFVYDLMLEIIVYYFGCQFLEMIFKYMSSDYIVNYIILEMYEIKKRKLGKSKDISNNEDSDVDNNSLWIVLKEIYY